MRFASFFSKLAEMMERLTGHLEYVIEYGERFVHYPKVQSVSIIPNFVIYFLFRMLCYGSRSVLGLSSKHLHWDLLTTVEL